MMQDQVLSFLNDPVVHGGAEVRRIDTHASVVFLAGNRALKIKRAVKLPYLDYSTLERRQAACELELQLNKPQAPQIYRRVVPITLEPDGTFKIDGRGARVECALEMTRFDEQQTLDRIAASRQIDETIANDIANAIMAWHQRAESSADSAWVASIPKLIAANTSKFLAAANFPKSAIERLDRLSLDAHARLRSTLESRAKDGLVRRCHGDLHLANIVLIDNKPVLFDAIEFDAAIATTDVLYDLAFVVMDLLRFGQMAAAATVFNRYLSASKHRNIEGLAAFPLFMSMRAGVRAQVLLTRYAQQSERLILGNAQAYFDLAGRLIAPEKPLLLAIGGPSGTGKSALARALAGTIVPPPGAIILRSDVLRKRLFNVDEMTALPADAYQPAISTNVYETIRRTAHLVLAQGFSVIADAAYLRAAERAAIEQVAVENGLDFCGLFLKTDLSTRISRITSRRDDASDATCEIAKLQEQYDIGPLNWIEIDASDRLNDVVKRAAAELPSMRHRSATQPHR